MRINLPTDLLRSFLAIVDTGSMMRATDHVFLSSSALSLQMKRLEELVNRQLFQRSGRSLVLTAAGRELVTAARKILELNDDVVGSLHGETLFGLVQLGMVQDFAETKLPDILRAFSDLHPRTQLQLRVAGSTDLMDMCSRGALDIALCIGRPGDPQARQSTPTLWLGNPALATQEEIPLVLLDAPCLFRSSALRALQDAGQRFRVAVETPSLSGMRAAVQAGLGLTCRTNLLADWAGLPVVRAPNLPAVPDVSYTLWQAEALTGAGRRLASLVEAALHPPAPAVEPPARAVEQIAFGQLVRMREDAR